MSKTTFVGYLRALGTNKKNSTPAVLPMALQISFDPTVAPAALNKFLPAGAIPLTVQLLGGATGGSSPTVNIGTQADPDGFCANCAAVNTETVGGGQTATGGVLWGTPLTEKTEIYAGVGASAATGGTVTAVITYIMEDDGQ